METAINLEVYDELGARWYEADDDPIALLRAEARLRNPWIVERIAAELGRGAKRVLDVGCGGGFLANALAEAGHSVEGIDLSEPSLEIARRYDRTGRVKYRRADAYDLPHAPGELDVVCAMDFLEHVDRPDRVIAQAARVLRPGGLFFFHTFDRTFLSWLIVVKGVEWAVRNTPKNLHLHEMFIPPADLERMCVAAGLEMAELRGMRPEVFSLAFWRMLATGRVPKSFRFAFTKRPGMAYIGYARRR
jgi:2-polyprenyl-6-hydroxyphenyl methylase / 3-demethylubiquinone-9 3-methyltransferase